MACSCVPPSAVDAKDWTGCPPRHTIKAYVTPYCVSSALLSFPDRQKNRIFFVKMKMNRRSFSQHTSFYGTPIVIRSHKSCQWLSALLQRSHLCSLRFKNARSCHTAYKMKCNTRLQFFILFVETISLKRGGKAKHWKETGKRKKTEASLIPNQPGDEHHSESAGNVYQYM